MFYTPTGPLSGVTSTALFVWLISWWALASRWRNKTVPLTKVNILGFLPLALSLLVTFPPFEHLLLGK
jgi:hypothetical protein